LAYADPALALAGGAGYWRWLGLMFGVGLARATSQCQG